MNPYSERGSARYQRQARDDARHDNQQPASVLGNRRSAYVSFESDEQEPTTTGGSHSEHAQDRTYGTSYTPINLFEAENNTILGEQCATLSHEAIEALVKRNKRREKLSLNEVGSHGDPERNWVRGSDLRPVSLAEAQQYKELLEEKIGATDTVINQTTSKQTSAVDAGSTQNKATANTSSAADANAEKRPFWYPRQCRPPSRDMRVFRIFHVENLRPGQIVWMKDKGSRWHLAVLLDIDYVKSKVTVLTFYTYGGTGIQYRYSSRQFYVNPWHPAMKGSWNSKMDCPHPPVRIDGPDQPNNKFHEQFSEDMVLRVYPGEELPIEGVWAIVGEVSPAFLDWTLEFSAQCLKAKPSAGFDEAVKWLPELEYGESLLVKLMADASRERARIDQTPPDMSTDAKMTYEVWARQLDKDPLVSRWAPRSTPLFFAENLSSLCRFLDKICSKTKRKPLESVLSDMDSLLVVCRAVLTKAYELRNEETNDALKSVRHLKNSIEALHLPEDPEILEYKDMLLAGIEPSLQKKTGISPELGLLGIGSTASKDGRSEVQEHSSLVDDDSAEAISSREACHEDNQGVLQADGDSVANPAQLMNGATEDSNNNGTSTRGTERSFNKHYHAKDGLMRRKCEAKSAMNGERSRSRSPSERDRQGSRRDRSQGRRSGGWSKGKYGDSTPSQRSVSRGPRRKGNQRGGGGGWRGDRRTHQGNGWKPQKADHYHPPDLHTPDN